MTIHLVINTVIVKQYFHFKANMLSLYKLSEFSNYKGGNDLWHVIKLYLLEVVM